eukprot:TRINITY_DN10879_c0_g1_i1.p1 TRINITY_DN10879_c0_g1~~TRINITY_DN10879_c0_g1_i1.p1  ORF type:complete len:732 (+),score=221.38 TRINITY_DN10879_c0_g1_i1:21-2216(+)
MLVKCFFVLLLALVAFGEDLNPDDFVVPEVENSEGHVFQAEINKLMGIIINSLYSNRDIFLRELVSNAADALDKAKYLQLTNADEFDSSIPMEIRIYADEENNLLYITDTGIGMTKDELVANLGSIAKSGTKEFLEKVQSTGDVNQIGQFGVGFYSSFLVADTVTVVSKNADDDQYIWRSSAESDASYTVSRDPRGNTLGRGTQIILTLKEDAGEYLQVDKLRELVLRYNEFINFPIYIWTSSEITKEIPVEKESEESEDDLLIDDFEDDEPETQTVTEVVSEWERINSADPLWRRPKTEITEEEYNAFYRNVLKESKDPLYYSHFKGEGEYDFTGLLYIPEEAPFGLYEPSFSSSFKLYVKRVFITDNFEEFMPRYLSFIKGLVDSDELDLNVSREILQKSRALMTIKKRLVRKAIAMMQEIARDDEEKYKKLYQQYSQSIKLGVIEDYSNRDRLTQLLKYYTAKHTDEQITLDQYIDEMKKNQDKIYFLGGDSKEVLLKSPLIERLVKKGYDVVLMTDSIDSYVMNTLLKYQGKYSFVNVGKEGVDLGDNMEELKDTYAPLVDFLKEELKQYVSKVQLSSRLTSTPAAVISSTYGYTADMEKIVKAQALNDPRYASLLASKKIFEINPRHPIVKKLNSLVSEDLVTDETVELIHVLYDTALLGSGYTLEEPAGLTGRVTNLLSISLGVENEPIEELEEPEEIEEIETLFEEVDLEDIPTENQNIEKEEL